MTSQNTGVLVKYHPCTIYARRGSICCFFEEGSKHCGKPPLSCELREYDLWFKEVLAGEIRFYYLPKRIYLFEVPGIPLFLYHSDRRKIVGEAAIRKMTSENNFYYYWFDIFLIYPKPVDLSRLKTDQRLRKLSARGRWQIVYVNKVTISEIRDLSGLPMNVRRNLADELQTLEQRISETQPQRYRYFQSCKHPLDYYPYFQEIGRKHSFDRPIIDTAYRIFLEAREKGMLRGRSASKLIFASLYLALRMLKVPTTINEIATVANCHPKELSAYYRALVERLSLFVPILHPKDFILEYSKKLSISEKTIKHALYVVENIEKPLLCGKAPRVIAAACVHIACKENKETITQVAIAKEFNTTSASIRNCLKFLSSSCVNR